MSIHVHALSPEFGAEIGDADLSAPLSAEDTAAIRQAFARYSVLVFPDQVLDAGAHLRFAQVFGPLETSIGVHRKDHKLRLQPQLADVSNLDHENRLLEPDSRQRMFNLGNQLWHTDSSFKFVPALASLLYARTIPPVGGQTEFADMRAAWDALPALSRLALQGRIAEHSIFYSRARLGYTDFSDEERAAMPPVPQMLVRRHADSGRMGLYLASHIGHVYGSDRETGAALVDALIEHATQRQFVYAHRWRRNDLVIWDNRCTMHRGTPFDDLRWPRDVQRATVSDVANTCAQAGVAAPAPVGRAA